MNIVRELTEEHKRRHLAHRAKWFSRITSTEPIDQARVRTAVTSLFVEVSLPRPEHFLYYQSPAAALADFRHWQPLAGRGMTCFWPFQLPLCDPWAYWRQCGDRGDVVDLAVHRRPNPLGCYAFGEPVEGSGSLVAAAVLRQLWALSAPSPEIDWCSRVPDHLFARYPDELASLEESLDPEDGLSAHPHEIYLLGPFHWLVQEVACADSCATILGCRRNEALFGPLEELLDAGGLVFVFRNLCIACERPQEMLGPPLTVRFGDGYEVTTAPLDLPPLEDPDPEDGP